MLTKLLYKIFDNFFFSVESIELLKFWIQDITVTVWINCPETLNFELFWSHPKERGWTFTIQYLSWQSQVREAVAASSNLSVNLDEEFEIQELNNLQQQKTETENSTSYSNRKLKLKKQHKLHPASNSLWQPTESFSKQ